MPDENRDCEDRERRTAKPPLGRVILWLAGIVLFMAATMFLPAGKLGWLRGWVFLVTYGLLGIVATCYLWRTNPEVIAARSTFHRGSKGWDKAPVFLLLVSFMAMFPVAAFDDGRFHWSLVPLWLTVVGYILMLIGMAGNVWALSVNKFAEPTVRIQMDRGHKLVDTGPYAIVRHPLYATAFFLCGGIPLALGSFWALLPAAIGVAVLVVRTALEDRMLHGELDGYKEYAGRVRYRLIPGVW
jgi:protein-S-isoprenylcysteine O-methyltransferase Ste14